MFDDLSSFANRVGRGIGSLKRDLDQRIGRTDHPQIVPYRSYGNQAEVQVWARVLRNPGLTRAAAGDAWWRNLLNTYKRIESDEIGGALVRVRAFGQERAARADQEGFLRVTLPAGGAPTRSEWQSVELELLEPARPQGERVRATAAILQPLASARFGVISDLDDTVIRTDVHNVPRMIRAIALGNAHTRLPFQGVAAFYRALQRGAGSADGNPIFYVSSSPWNLYDLLEEFLAIRGIPAGPLILRDWGFGVNLARNAPHKLAAISHVLDAYPRLPFILIGDSGQEDPEIYRDVVARYPHRILAIYIRNVTPEPERSRIIRDLVAQVTASRSTMVLTDDTMMAARHALQHGWIAEEAIGEIERDEAAERAAGPAPESETDPADTLIVDRPAPDR